MSFDDYDAPERIQAEAAVSIRGFAASMAEFCPWKYREISETESMAAARNAYQNAVLLGQRKPQWSHVFEGATSSA
jgi:hypothetical protein